MMMKQLVFGRLRFAWITGSGPEKMTLGMKFAEESGKYFSRTSALLEYVFDHPDVELIRFVKGCPYSRLLVLKHVDRECDTDSVVALASAVKGSQTRVVVLSEMCPPQDVAEMHVELRIRADDALTSSQLNARQAVVESSIVVRGPWSDSGPMILSSKRKVPEEPRSTLLDRNGKPLSASSEQYGRITTQLLVVSEAALRELSNNPKRFFDLSPREFEVVIAETLTRLGCIVELTASSRDGGKDIYAIRQDHLGSFLFIVECKRYAPTNKVGVGVIRALYGVVQAERATAGIVAATSFFTHDAREFQRRISAQMALKDYCDIQDWLDSALTG